MSLICINFINSLFRFFIWYFIAILMLYSLRDRAKTFDFCKNQIIFDLWKIHKQVSIHKQKCFIILMWLSHRFVSKQIAFYFWNCHSLLGLIWIFWISIDALKNKLQEVHFNEKLEADEMVFGYPCQGNIYTGGKGCYHLCSCQPLS